MVLSDYTKRKEYDKKISKLFSKIDIFQPMKFDSMFNNVLRNFPDLESYNRMSINPRYSKSVSIETENINGKQAFTEEKWLRRCALAQGGSISPTVLHAILPWNMLETLENTASSTW